MRHRCRIGAPVVGLSAMLPNSAEAVQFKSGDGIHRYAFFFIPAGRGEWIQIYSPEENNRRRALFQAIACHYISSGSRGPAGNRFSLCSRSISCVSFLPPDSPGFHTGSGRRRAATESRRRIRHVDNASSLLSISNALARNCLNRAVVIHNFK